MLGWLRSRRSAVTFDLGATGIRACQLQRRDGVFRLCDSLQIERAPTDTNEAAGAAPAVDPVQLDRLIGQGSFVGREVALVVSPPETQFLPLRLPEQALAQLPERIEEALRWEVSQESRKPADDLEVRHWKLPRGHGQQANVMAVAMSASQAVRWHELFLQHRLQLRRIDLAPCALVRIACSLWTPAENDLWGVLDLGLRHSTLTIVVGVVPTYIRLLSVLASQWTEQLAAALDVAYPVAEQFKRQHAVNPAERRARAPAPGANPSQISDFTRALTGVLRGSLKTLAHEVGRCFSYVMQSFPDVAVRRLWLAGGGGGLNGLSEFLSTQLDIPVLRLATGRAADGGAETHMLPGVRCEPYTAAALGGALLDLEAS